MSLPKYMIYKDSGVKWIGCVPAHWKIDRIKASIASSRNGTWGDEPRGDENDIACVRVADFDRNTLQVKPQILTVRSLTQKERNGQILRRGDLLLEKSGGGDLQPVGQVVVYQLDTPAVCSNFVARVVLKPGMNSGYWNYVHSAAYAVGVNLGSINQTSGIQNLDQDRYFNERAPFPPESEQSAIAAFLDRETAKIDAMIAAQGKLIALLAEKRQATISYAVTTGLNPSAPMKDSGVAWLREMPAHWSVTRLKYVTDAVVDCPHETPVYEEAGPYRVIRTADVSEGMLHLDQMYTVAQQEFLRRIRRMPLEQNDIVYSREGARWGFAAQVPASDTFCLGQRMMQFRAVAGIDPRFLMWQLNAQSTYRQGQMDTVGAASPHVNVGTIKNYILSHPPIAEQKEISKFLDAETSKLDKLDAEAVRTISLLRQRRSALIAAAVTGQIDVRGVIPQAAVESPEAIAA